MKSVYIHIPFCSSICSYCDFCKFIYSTSWAEAYIKELKEEIIKYYENETIKTIYIGGGTPSVLNVSELNKLNECIKLFKLSKNCEFTFEMNINDITEEKLLLLKNIGVNRLSIGIQSFNELNLKYLNRKHRKKDILLKIALAKKHFDNINVDLMFALPIESYKVLKSDVKKFINLGIQHISTYSLIIENGTILSINKTRPIQEELDYMMYKYICNKLKKVGYHHYEVSNFALHGYESIHNKTYWQNEEYYGFGLGAHGFINGVRYENTKSFNKYLKKQYRTNEILLSTKEDMENEIILGLRLLKGINIIEFFKKYNTNIQDVFNISSALKNKLLLLENNQLFIPESKIYIMNEIINSIIK